jgi:hypothetical protein
MDSDSAVSGTSHQDSVRRFWQKLVTSKTAIHVQQFLIQQAAKIIEDYCFGGFRGTHYSIFNVLMTVSCPFKNAGISSPD